MFERTVFINCPFDPEYFILEPILYVVVAAGLTPRLANERLDAGENRLDKICELIRAAKYSIHDLSRCRDLKAGEFNRMNMPFELGIDFGMRRAGAPPFDGKQFLIFERDQYDLKRALSDIAGQDVAAHSDREAKAIKAVREFLSTAARVKLAGPTQLQLDYGTFLAWLIEKKKTEGHSEEEARTLPTAERLEEMTSWVASGRPAIFSPTP